MILIAISKLIKRSWSEVIPGGDMELSNEEGIVISITGLRDGKPLQASWQADLISSILA